MIMKRNKLFLGALFCACIQLSYAQGNGNGNGNGNSQGNAQWKVNGNTVDDSSYFGSNNNKPIIFKTDNAERFRLTPQGNFGLGTPTPSAKLHVLGNSTLDGSIQMPSLTTLSGTSLTPSHSLVLLDTNGNAREISYQDFLSEVQKGVYVPPGPEP